MAPHVVPSRRIGPVLLLTLTLTLAACGSSSPKDASGETSGETSAPNVAAANTETSTAAGGEYQIVSDAEVSEGLTATLTLAGEAVALITADPSKAEAAVTATYDKWFTYEGTVKKRDQSVYLDMEDALGLIKTGQADGDATKATKGIDALSTLAAAYVAKFPADGSAPPPSVASALGGAAVAVPTGLSEWKIALPEAIKAGATNFVLKNVGKEVHVFVIFRTDLPLDQLPLDAEGGVDEKGAGLTFVDERENVKPGTSSALKVDLAPGRYVFACNLKGHLKNGMVHEVVVA